MCVGGARAVLPLLFAQLVNLAAALAEDLHLVRAPRAKSRVLEMQLSAHAPAFTADLPAFNGCPGLQPTRCRCALVRVIAAAHLLYANHISTDDHGSCGVRAPVELIL